MYISYLLVHGQKPENFLILLFTEEFLKILVPLAEKNITY